MQLGFLVDCDDGVQQLATWLHVWSEDVWERCIIVVHFGVVDLDLILAS